MSESFRQLRHVLALYEHRNYRRAAEALHLTQSALSVSIRRIEDEYGVPLFIRDQAGVRPTEYGEVVVNATGGLVSLDALAAAERENWVWAGSNSGLTP